MSISGWRISVRTRPVITGWHGIASSRAMRRGRSRSCGGPSGWVSARRKIRRGRSPTWGRCCSRPGCRRSGGGIPGSPGPLSGTSPGAGGAGGGCSPRRAGTRTRYLSPGGGAGQGPVSRIRRPARPALPPDRQGSPGGQAGVAAGGRRHIGPGSGRDRRPRPRYGLRRPRPSHWPRPGTGARRVEDRGAVPSSRGERVEEQRLHGFFRGLSPGPRCRSRNCWLIFCSSLSVRHCWSALTVADDLVGG